ncbi:type IV pilus modification protein PilV [Diaphorobacter sp.]|uniref:type IV pilus modification protein PilV n=1 Tax=Diaphorobacter sp. TaxID=1934310 RepID=UPI0028A88251|nr:type IV pilus modification protein PilV [Diaphorobacter sp.]
MRKMVLLRNVRHRVRQQGAGLIEVLVAVLVVTVGLLGAAGMHLRSVEYTLDTERRQMAAMVAAELLETMRSDSNTVLDWATGLPKSDLGGYQKDASDELTTVTEEDCRPLATSPAKRLGCWGERAKKLMPEVSDDLLTDHFVVHAAATGVVSVTVAWPVKAGQCLDGTENEFCTYTLQSRI